MPNPWDKRALSDFCHSDLRSGEGSHGYQTGLGLRYELDPKGKRKNPVVVCLNLSGKDLTHYKVGVPAAKVYQTLLDTDAASFGGSGKRMALSYQAKPDGWNGYDHHIVLSLPALSGIILK